jgi:N-acetylglucosamine-6-sulfatase
MSSQLMRGVRWGTALAAAALLALAGSGCGSGEATTTDTRTLPLRPPAPESPNIVVITADDETLEMFNRGTMPRTFRLLVDHGTRFSNFIATTPECCPSRAAFLTGQYGHNNGVLSNSYGELQEPARVLPAWLRPAGYRTAHLGRYLNGFSGRLDDPDEATPGWDEWFTLLQYRYFNYDIATGDGSRRFGARPGDYLTRVLTRKAVSLIDRFTRRPRPLYLQLDELAPHFGSATPSYRCSGGHSAIPDPRDARRFLQAVPPRKPSFNEPRIADKSGLARALPRLDRAERSQIDHDYGCALATVQGLDRSVAAVVGALRKVGELDRTMIVFWSDNGYYYGEHRIPAKKQFPYEEGIHLPLVIRMPHEGGDRAPARVRAPVANIDLAPTILDLTGARACEQGNDCRVLDGRSLVPLLRGRQGAWPRPRPLGIEIALEQNHETYERPCRYSGVRVNGRVLIHEITAAKPGEPCRAVDQYEYYNLRRDPYELRNIYSNASGADRRELRSLRKTLDRLRDCAGIRGRDPRPASGHFCG